MNMVRTMEVAGGAWRHLLTALEQPGQLPQTLSAISKGVRPSQYFKLNQAWIHQAGIRTVLDVGAHKGEFSKAILTIIPQARIYAFEPLPDCYSYLSRQMSRNGSFQSFPVAIGRESGSVVLWRSSYDKSSSVLPMAELHKASFPWSAGASPVEVEMRTLDEYIGRLELNAKTLLKIDVQGYEAQVLRGATELLKQVEYVLVEVSFRPLYEGQASFAEVYSLLQGAGFSYSGSLEQLLSPLDDSILQSDAFFARSG